MFQVLLTVLKSRFVYRLDLWGGRCHCSCGGAEFEDSAVFFGQIRKREKFRFDGGSVTEGQVLDALRR